MKKEENMLSLKKGQSILIKGQEEALRVVNSLNGNFTYGVNDCVKAMKRGRSVHTVHVMPEYKFRVSIIGDTTLKKDSAITTGLVLKSIKIE